MKRILCLSLMSVASAFADESTTTIPLQVVNVGHHSYKVGIDVSVAGGPPSPVTFDTGGSGLHILASQVGKSNIQYTQITSTSSFESGLTYEGVIAYAPVTIGGVTTKPISILVIQKVYCAANKPKCGVSASNPLLYGQFYGELGASMRPEVHVGEPQRTLVPPLAAMPGNYGSGFIIQNLAPKSTGQLVLGLTPQNTAGFSRVPLPTFGTFPGGTTAYNDKGLMVNYTIGDMTQSLATSFDTGGTSIIHIASDVDTALLAQNGVHIRNDQSFDANLPGAFDWQFITGNTPAENMVAVEPIGLKGPMVNTGITFYFNYDVLRDFAHGQMGFKPQGE